LVAIVVAGLEAAGLQDPRVLVERIAYDDGRPTRGPVVVRAEIVDLNDPTTVTIVLDYADARDAFAITLHSGRF
jgi:hypothetical protein